MLDFEVDTGFSGWLGYLAMLHMLQRWTAADLVIGRHEPMADVLCTRCADLRMRVDIRSPRDLKLDPFMQLSELGPWAGLR